jgi:hypothetical protein
MKSANAMEVLESNGYGVRELESGGYGVRE